MEMSNAACAGSLAGKVMDSLPADVLNPCGRWPFTVTFDLLHSTTGHILLRASDGAPALHAFHEKLTKALVRAGMRRWLAWNFNPHVTLSYGACAVHERAIEPVSWTVRDFGLIESLYGPHRHIERGRWMLESGDPPIAPRRRPADAGRDAAW